MRHSKTEVVVLATVISIGMLAFDGWIAMLIIGMMHSADAQVPALGFSVVVGALLVLRIAGIYLRGTKEYFEAVKKSVQRQEGAGK